MGQIVVEKNAGGIAGLCVITPALHRDGRGAFMETYSRRDLEENGLDYTFVQDNQASSVRGVLRGLHFQLRHPQAKLLRVIRGRVYDVTVDLRRESPTRGRAFGILLSEENRRQLLVPRGFAHGYLALSDTAEILYKCDDFYFPGDEGGLAWDDPALGIGWPGVTRDARGLPCLEDGTPLIIADRDLRWPGLEACGWL